MSPNPFATVWTSPRATVRRIIAEDPELHVALLACLAGVGATLDRASMRNVGDHLSLAVIIGMACLLGPFGGLLSLWITSHLLRWTGKWIGGTATRQHVATAMAWAAVPVVVSLPLWIPQLLLFGSDMFTKETPRLDAQPLLFIFFSLGDAVLFVWSFVLLCQMVAEVNGFRSAWRGLGNVLLSGAVILVPLILLILLLVAITRP